MLKIESLSYRYPAQFGKAAQTALHGFSLTLERGESFGFLGHNGAGKTTTIKCILNLVHPTKGVITIDGVSSADPRARCKVGYLPEQPYFYDHLTAAEAVEMYARLAGLSRHDAVRQTTVALERTGVADRARSRMRTLSKGLVQRVAMAQAIVAAPELLILDEPFSGLDPLGRREFRELIFALREAGTTIFMSSHVLNDVERLCDRVSIMSRGELKGVFDLSSLPQTESQGCEITVVGSAESTRELAVGAMSKLQERGAFCYMYANRTAAESALRIALNQGIQVISFQVHQPSLEELFTRLVSTGGSSS